MTIHPRWRAPILFIVVLILLLGGGGDYYGYNRHDGSGLGGALGFALIVLIELWRASTTPDAASKPTCVSRHFVVTESTGGFAEPGAGSRGRAKIVRRSHRLPSQLPRLCWHEW